MTALRPTLKRHRALVAAACAAGLVSGLATIVVIHLIHLTLSGLSSSSVSGLGFVSALLAAFCASIIAKFTLNHLGAEVIHSLRDRMVRGVLSTPFANVEAAGEAKVYATLTEDLDALASAFGLIPGLTFSVALVFGGFAYLLYLSPSHFVIVVVVVATGVATSLGVKAHADHLLKVIRGYKGELFVAFVAMLKGSKELRLSQRRRQLFYTHYVNDVEMPLKRNTVRVHNWLSTIEEFAGLFALLAVGAILFDLPLVGPIESSAKAGFVLTILFITAPIRTIFDGTRTLLRCGVSLHNIRRLDVFDSYPREESLANHDSPVSQVVELKGVQYRYRQKDCDEGFSIGPIDLVVRTGEVVFVVGGNGSGKSTFAKVLTGLYRPDAGEIRLNGQLVQEQSREWYCEHFTAVFSDFYLFKQLICRGDLPIEDEVVLEQLRQLRLDHKVDVRNATLVTGPLSTGQAKRLALLIARMEGKAFYLLDEWAAEQDVEFRTFFYQQLLPELKRENKAVVCISHDAQYYHVADRAFRMEDGQLTPLSTDVSVPASRHPSFDVTPEYREQGIQ